MLRPLSPSLRSSLEQATAQYQTHVGLAEEYLESRGISRSIAETYRLGVVVEPMAGHERMVGRLAIPYLGRANTVSGLRFRSIAPVGDGDGGAKYLGLAGVELRLYGVRSLHEAGDSIHITEGELDAVSLGACSLSAVGVPGVKAWRPHHARLFAGFSRVYVWGDGDDPGREFAQRIAREVDSAVVVHIPDGMDVNSLLVESGPDSIRAMCQ